MLFPGFAHKEQAFFVAGHSSFDGQEISLGIYQDNFQVLGCHALVAHVPSHPQTFEDATRCGGRTDGAGSAHAVGLAVRFGATVEAMTFDYARKALALGSADDIYPLSHREHADIELLPALIAADIIRPHFAQVAQRGQLLQMALFRLVQALGISIADLNGIVLVMLFGLDLCNIARPSFNECDGNNISLSLHDALPINRKSVV